MPRKQRSKQYSKKIKKKKSFWEDEKSDFKLQTLQKPDHFIFPEMIVIPKFLEEEANETPEKKGNGSKMFAQPQNTYKIQKFTPAIIKERVPSMIKNANGAEAKVRPSMYDDDF